MIQMKRVLFHVAVICGLVSAVAKVLDWYNPYMDFGGHVSWVGMTGCVAVFLFAVLNIAAIFQRNLEEKRCDRRSMIHDRHMKTHCHHAA